MNLNDRFKQFLRDANSPGNMATSRDKLAKAIGLMQEFVDKDAAFQQEISQQVVRAAARKVIGDFMRKTAAELLEQREVKPGYRILWASKDSGRMLDGTVLDVLSDGMLEVQTMVQGCPFIQRVHKDDVGWVTKAKPQAADHFVDATEMMPADQIVDANKMVEDQAANDAETGVKLTSVDGVRIVDQRLSLSGLKPVVREVLPPQVGDRVRYAGFAYTPIEPWRDLVGKTGTVVETRGISTEAIVKFDVETEYAYYVMQYFTLEKLDADGLPWAEDKL